MLDPWGWPLLNTLILLCSGTTVTWAHHSLIHGDREGLKKGLLATIALGLVFTAVQAYEYMHAPFAFKTTNGRFAKFKVLAKEPHPSNKLTFRYFVY